MDFNDTLSHRDRVYLETQAATRRSGVDSEISLATTPTPPSGGSATTASESGQGKGVGGTRVRGRPLATPGKGAGVSAAKEYMD